MVNVNDVADYVLSRASTERALSTVKLQKLLYYAQGWNFAISGRPLFPGDFQAWRYGPVNPEIYDLHAGQTHLQKGFTFKGNPNALSESEKMTVDFVLKHYGEIPTFKLADQTHLPGTPWYQATYPDGPDGEAQFWAPIPDDLIREYFKTELERVRAGGLVVQA